MLGGATKDPQDKSISGFIAQRLPGLISYDLNHSSVVSDSRRVVL